MRPNKGKLLRGIDSWHLQEIPMAKTENGSQRRVYGAGEKLSAQTFQRKIPHFTNMSYRLLSSRGENSALHTVRRCR